MKTSNLLRVIVVLTVFALIAVGSAGSVMAQQTSPSSPQGGGGPGPIGNGFIYQGELKNSGSPFSGLCDFTFSLWDSSGSGTPPTGGTQVGAVEAQTNVPVANGLFTVTLNSSGQFNPASSEAFMGDMRFLMISVRCPAGSGPYTTLAPRQLLNAVPYASGLMPGTRMLGGEYQNLKIQSNTTLTGVPAAVTGEMLNSTDGVGVYGSSSVTTAGATGMGVWGRSYSPNGTGLMGTGYNGATGLNATSNGNGTSSPAIYAEATSTYASTPGGIAIYAVNHGGDATIVTRNAGTGDNFRALNGAGNLILFSVSNTGKVTAPVVQIYGGADLAEKFNVSSEKPEPGTLMVIDPENPGKLMPSTSAYDSKVAGVVSGAGGVTPGMTLSQDVLGGDTPIAIAGRVYVKAEAFKNPIKPGDLLTTSDLPGYAMKAADRSLAAGAVIGKAMTGLDSGTGLVLVLINLQ